LQERARSGEGQFVDMTLHDCGMALLHPHGANYLLNGKRPQPTGNPHPNISPYSAFRTATCQIFVACGNDPAFRKFCNFLELPDLPADPRFRGNGDRVVNRDALTAILEEKLSKVDGHAFCDQLLAIGLPAGPVLHIDEALSEPHTAHREMVTELGGFRALGTPIKLSRTPGGTRAPPPRFNQHGEDVLARHGYSPEDIEALKRDGTLVEARR
jgi:formyl-CoA transferase